MKKIIGLYSRFGSIENMESDNADDCIAQLEIIADSGEGFNIVCFDQESKEILWFQDFIGLDACKKHIDDFVNSGAKQ